ncbi:hypothetical protein C6P40_003226, partial [Pichia californica]
MFTKIRNRYLLRFKYNNNNNNNNKNKLIIQNQIRHNSNLKNSNNQLNFNKQNDDQQRQIQQEEEGEDGKDNGKFSDTLNSFLNSSLNSLENYIINQAPIKDNNQGFNNDMFELDNDDSNKYNNNTNLIPYDLSIINEDFNEYIDLTNENHIEKLLSIDNSIIFKYGPQIEQNIKKTSNINLPLILNFYIRSLPKIQKRLNNSSLNIIIGDNILNKIISILINLQWFKSVSFIIINKNLSFNELINLINSLLENELIFQKSNWLKFKFLIEFYEQFKNINPLIITNIDFLNNSKNLNRFKILNLIQKKNYNNQIELNDDFNEFNEILNNDLIIKS